MSDYNQKIAEYDQKIADLLKEISLLQQEVIKLKGEDNITNLLYKNAAEKLEEMKACLGDIKKTLKEVGDKVNEVHLPPCKDLNKINKEFIELKQTLEHIKDSTKYNLEKRYKIWHLIITAIGSAAAVVGLLELITR